MSGNVPALVRWLVRAGLIPRAAVAQLDNRSAPHPQAVLDGGRLAEKTFQVLDQLGQDLVLIARMGQNLSQFGLTYSHLGFCRRAPDGEWGVVHLLNQEDAANSSIFEEGIGNFYADNPYRFEAGILTLPAPAQQAVLATLGAHARTLHCPHYSLTSHPCSISTQNSNQWVLEVLVAALGALERPTRLQTLELLKASSYRATRLPIALPTQWVGPLLRDSIRFTDQPDAELRQGIVSTVTVDSVYEWLTGPTSPFGEEGRRDCRLLSLGL